MAQTKTTAAADANEVTISPEALAAIGRAVSEATLASTRRENDRPTPMNAIGYKADTVPALKYKEVFYCGAPQKAEWLKPEEARLYNAITTPGFYGPDKTWEVRLKDDRLHVLIHGVNKREVRMDLPRSLEDILKTIVSEQNAVAA